MSVFDDMVETALELITENGALGSVQVRVQAVVTTPSLPHRPAPGTVTTYPAHIVFGEMNFFDRPEDWRTGDAMAYIAASELPVDLSAGDRVITQGKTWTVQKSTTYSPNGERILVEAHVRV